MARTKRGETSHTNLPARTIVAGITQNLVIGIIVTVFTVGGGIFWMAKVQDRQAEEASKTMVTGGLEAEADRVKTIANDYGWWQEEYNAYVTNDEEWLDDNLGDAVEGTRIADFMAILSPRGTLEYGWAYEDFGIEPEDMLSPELIEGIQLYVKDMPVENLAARSMYLVVDDKVALVAISHVTPTLRASSVERNELPLFVVGIFLTNEQLEELGQSFLIDDLHVVLGSDASEDTYKDFPEFKDLNGTSLRFVWTPPSPSVLVLQRVALPIGAALVLFCIIAIVTTYRAKDLAGALVSEKERIEAIMSSIGEGILVIDTNGKIFLSNNAAGTLLGYTPKELVGLSLMELFGMEKADAGSPLKKILEVARTRVTLRVPEAHFTRKDGNIVLLALTATPVEHKGVFIGAIIVFHDVTEQRLLDSAKQQFISTAAHQLRTPLSGIKWAISSLLGDSKKKKGPTKKEQKELLTKSYDSINELVALVNDLLNVDRIESNRMDFVFEPTDIKVFLRDLVTELKPHATRKKLSLTLETPKTVPTLMLDAKSMRIAIQNLIENAIHYTAEGGSIKLTVISEEKNVRIDVSDTGIGIPRSQQGRIFTRFFRASNAVLTQTEGTGLGLYIVKQIVAEHRGTILFESEEGKGTTFHVMIPLKS